MAAKLDRTSRFLLVALMGLLASFVWAFSYQQFKDEKARDKASADLSRAVIDSFEMNKVDRAARYDAIDRRLAEMERVLGIIPADPLHNRQNAAFHQSYEIRR